MDFRWLNHDGRHAPSWGGGGDQWGTCSSEDDDDGGKVVSKKGSSSRKKMGEVKVGGGLHKGSEQRGWCRWSCRLGIQEREKKKKKKREPNYRVKAKVDWQPNQSGARFSHLLEKKKSTNQSFQFPVHDLTKWQLIRQPTAPLHSIASHIAARRSPLAFINRDSSFRPICFTGAPTLRIVSVHYQKPGSERSAVMSETTAPSRSSSSSTASAIDFLTLCHRLKGWINHGIKGPESIADHIYRMALIACDLPGVNRERCIKIAIVHDIAEAIVGDITPSDGVPKEEKSSREQAALTEMCKILGGGMRAEEIQELWREYENSASLEANLVKDFDKVEMILQALEYEMEHGEVLDEFFLSTAGRENFRQRLERVGRQRSILGEIHDWQTNLIDLMD
ncbi:hypothetical protein CRYUN_Cryun04dG0213500 [Craigia yunnanensis]